MKNEEFNSNYDFENGPEVIGYSASLLANTMLEFIKDPKLTLKTFDKNYPSLRWHTYAARWLVYDLLDSLIQRPSEDGSTSKDAEIYLGLHERITDGQCPFWILEEIAVVTLQNMLYFMRNASTKSDKKLTKTIKQLVELLHDVRTNMVEDGHSRKFNIERPTAAEFIDNPTPFHFVFDTISPLVAGHVLENLHRYVLPGPQPFNFEGDIPEIFSYTFQAHVSDDKAWQFIKDNLPDDFYEVGYIREGSTNRQLGFEGSHAGLVMYMRSLLKEACKNSESADSKGGISYAAVPGWELPDEIMRHYGLCQKVLASS